jgi:hypothetical protein
MEFRCSEKDRRLRLYADPLQALSTAAIFSGAHKFAGVIIVLAWIKPASWLTQVGQ